HLQRDLDDPQVQAAAEAGGARHPDPNPSPSTLPSPRRTRHTTAPVSTTGAASFTDGEVTDRERGRALHLIRAVLESTDADPPGCLGSELSDAARKALDRGDYQFGVMAAAAFGWAAWCASCSATRSAPYRSTPRGAPTPRLSWPARCTGPVTSPRRRFWPTPLR